MFLQYFDFLHSKHVVFVKYNIQVEKEFYFFDVNIVNIRNIND